MSKRILVIDDEAEMVQVIEVLLRRNGYEVVTAMDGRAGLEKARTERPDLVITDLNMPKMDGWRLCQQLKSEEGLRHIPVIMLSALVAHEDAAEGGRELGDDYISKPFELKKLLEKVQAWLPGTAAS